MTIETNSGWLRLYMTPGLGRSSLLKLMAAFGTSEAVFAATPQEWYERAGLPASLKNNLLPENDAVLHNSLRALEKTGTDLIAFPDKGKFPDWLRAIHDPPALLFVRGWCDIIDCLAVVGSRRASSSLRRYTRELCSDLAARELTIVSGLARGIDSAAHQGALMAGGKTIAVLGCGIDRVYPAENKKLFDEILEQGMIISEYPPGTAPLAHHFPARNRIISGLSRGTLVVEASQKSGSLITAEFALEQGREVFAVPGSVFSANSRGVNQLLRDGAHLVSEARDILDILWPEMIKNNIVDNSKETPQNLSPQELTILGFVQEKPCCLDDIARKSGLTPHEVSATLLHLELAGLIARLPGMQFSKT